MSSIVLKSYKVYCTTEAAYVFSYGYQLDAPTECPHNNTHTIDPNLTEEVASYNIDGVFIEMDKTQTGGNVLIYDSNIDIPSCSPGDTQEITILSLPFTSRLLGVYINAGKENVLDFFSIYLDPNSIIGTITSNIEIDDTVFSVSAGVISNIYLGYILSVTDGVNTEEYGYTISKDGPGGTITVQNAATIGFSSGSVVRMSKPMVIDLKIKSATPILLGNKNPGTSLILANTPILLRYKSNNGISKELCLTFDVIY